MTVPQGLSNCPPGLEYLSMIDGLLVHQKVELLEAFVGFETNNKYTVKNSVGQKVYYAVEDNDCCTRNCCGPMRPFDMKIMDNFRNEVNFHNYTSNTLYIPNRIYITVFCSMNINIKTNVCSKENYVLNNFLLCYLRHTEEITLKHTLFISLHCKRLKVRIISSWFAKFK